METEIRLGPQAKLVHGKVIYGGDLSSLARTQVAVEEGGYYDNFNLITGGKLVRNEIEVTLKGKLAQCALNGAMLLAAIRRMPIPPRISFMSRPSAPAVKFINRSLPARHAACFKAR